MANRFDLGDLTGGACNEVQSEPERKLCSSEMTDPVTHPNI